MAFQIRLEERPNAFGLDDRVRVLDDGRGSFVEIAPAIGFNAYRWHTPIGELLYADAKFFEEHKPTRSGIPILFPFPNRIRDGQFTWNTKEYRLPANDPSGKNAIHGFVCQRPWRALAEGADDHSAWVTGEFIGSRDGPETLDLWPADYGIRITYRLLEQRLEIDAELMNTDSSDLPFGLGYHPYFAIAPFGGQQAEVVINANKHWQLAESLPTGRKDLVDERTDLRGGKRYDSLRLDDVFTDLNPPSKTNGLALAGMVRGGSRRLEIYTDGNFREIVAFTPPHRQAICLEPYTCATDAINLQERGVDAGWRVLPAGAALNARVALWCHPE
jgi:aldose 1-epimerase